MKIIINLHSSYENALAELERLIAMYEHNIALFVEQNQQAEADFAKTIFCSLQQAKVVLLDAEQEQFAAIINSIRTLVVERALQNNCSLTSESSFDSIKKGLDYLGFGRWGSKQDHKVEYVSRNGKLQKLHAEREKYAGNKLSEKEHAVHDFKAAGFDPERLKGHDWIDPKIEHYKRKQQERHFAKIADSLIYAPA